MTTLNRKPRGPMSGLIHLILGELEGRTDEKKRSLLLSLLREAEDGNQRCVDDLEKLDPRSLAVLNEAEERREELHARLGEMIDEEGRAYLKQRGHEIDGTVLFDIADIMKKGQN